MSHIPPSSHGTPTGPLLANPHESSPQCKLTPTLFAPTTTPEKPCPELKPLPIESTAPTNVGKKNNCKQPTKDSAVQSQPTEKVMDLTQDSDEENSRLFRKKRCKVVKPSDEDFDDVEDYFHVPYLADVNDSQPLMYECKWCGNPYKKGLGTRSNLYLHRDGNLHRAPCAS
ncbi:hypothetical protein PGTUg99_014626 [Puccinia graminis f. sp. tritici]|uniref:Uncharacterized protein n=1 Tax=Puccinia graminis f. sp. tritici TaxID=56615 RepID=A0A5B0RVI7_PUCGR|nr:hypothetical protein PGTUg99_014626 [Puccinia graminis f. sp. tritici]